MIIFGLGNPGLKYRWTRHNAGYIFLDKMARRYKKKFIIHQGYKQTQIRIAKDKVKLIKPLCWMNQSGTAIKTILDEKDGEFLVVLDDINLPLGKIRLRSEGSGGGHLGLGSIIKVLNGSAFPRMRIGIGNADKDLISYVLSSFKKNEKAILNLVIEKGIEGLEIMFCQGFIKAQNFINSVNLSDSDGL